VASAAQCAVARRPTAGATGLHASRIDFRDNAYSDDHCAADERRQHRFAQLATSATVSMPCVCSLSAVTAPTPHSRGPQGCRNSSSLIRRDQQQPVALATWLATFARNLVRAIPTVIGSPTLAHVCAKPGRDAHRGACDPAQTADVKEGPRHRQCSTRGVVSRKTSTPRRRLAVGDIRRHHYRVRPTAGGPAAAIAYAAVSLCLVAAASTTPRLRITGRRAGEGRHAVDGRIERVEIGVQMCASAGTTYVASAGDNYAGAVRGCW